MPAPIESAAVSVNAPVVERLQRVFANEEAAQGSQG